MGMLSGSLLFSLPPLLFRHRVLAAQALTGSLRVQLLLTVEIGGLQVHHPSRSIHSALGISIVQASRMKPCTRAKLMPPV